MNVHYEGNETMMEYGCMPVYFWQWT